MKFHTVAGGVLNDPALTAEYRGARAIGVVRVGGAHLFFREGMRLYAVPHGDIRRCYRRVMRVPMKMCCGSGSLDVESLVIEGDSGELAQIQLPGTRAAVALMDLLKETLPHAQFTPPAREKAEARA